ncbi:hypothetical protein CK203_104867 [Vitis vinifera]|uniref:Uncharacterized protein n=1 Tax=Vitis vinifera TaxID=29760 RepID=A0A438DVP1_VITVI|nr:hypothetical protein CK203_104867 [Vitis vinifera]
MLDWKAAGMDPSPRPFNGYRHLKENKGHHFSPLKVSTSESYSLNSPLETVRGVGACLLSVSKSHVVTIALGSDDEIGPLSPLAVSLAAGFSGSVAAAASHSFDTAKSRSQCIVLPKYISTERRLLKWKQPGRWYERYTGIHPSDRSLLHRGIWLRMGRSGFASFLVVGSYFLAVDQLAR